MGQDYRTLSLIPRSQKIYRQFTFRISSGRRNKSPGVESCTVRAAQSNESRVKLSKLIKHDRNDDGIDVADFWSAAGQTTALPGP
jgi:hypothetical protein